MDIKERLLCGKKVTEIGLGTWQLGTKWGTPFNADEARRVLEAAYNGGITLIDTADCYLGGQSEQAIGDFIKTHPDRFFVSTKIGRRSNPHNAEAYTPETVEGFIDGSLERLGVEKLDMVLLHCPPTPVYDKAEVFEALEKIKKTGKIGAYGVSVEKVSEGIKAAEYGISAIEAVFNMFRHKPLDELFPLCKEKNIGILARVPLASGLLTGKFSKDTVFGEKDHRNYNRDGKSFDKGETFAGVDYEKGLMAVEELKKLFGTDDIAPYALKWILMHDEVSAVIPGASRAEQVTSNLRAEETAPLTAEQMKAVDDIYNKYIREDVHNNW